MGSFSSSFFLRLTRVLKTAGCVQGLLARLLTCNCWEEKRDFGMTGIHKLQPPVSPFPPGKEDCRGAKAAAGLFVTRLQWARPAQADRSPAAVEADQREPP